MSDLPEMLHGTIAQEHREMMQAVWLSDAPKPEEKTHHHKDCTRDCGEQTNDTCTPTCPQNCTDGPNCDKHPGKEYKAAFQPAVAGWSAPPPRHVR
jgi:hypothetical protein